VRRRKIGFVFQRFNLFPTLTVRGNLEIARQIQGNGVPPREELVRLLEMVGLAHKMDMKPLDLSAGEQQRIAIARAVVARPDLLIADEPTGNVDPEIGARLIRLFGELNRLGTTVLIATHDRALIESTKAREMRLVDGRLVELRTAARA
jgi:cell division transport system ATP-binding protein